MGIGACDDIDEVELFFGKEIGRISIEFWNSKLASGGFRPVYSRVADRHTLNALQFEPCRNLKTAPETAAKDSNAQCFHII